jgi:ADP-ribosylarginine hydrolase
MSNILSNKYYQILILHALGDTIGFRNGLWEFNYFDSKNNRSLDFINELIYDFIDLGGINGIDISDWNVSDDTLLHIATAKTMVNYKPKKYISETISNMLEEYDYMKKSKVNRYIGKKTKQRLDEIEKGNISSYSDKDAGGNGGVMRVMIIGACLRKSNDKLEQAIINNVLLTHSNYDSVYSSISIGLFVKYALEKIDIEKWPYLLIDHINEYYTEQEENNKFNPSDFIKHWDKYIDTKFVDKVPIKIRSFRNPLFRMKYYHDTFFKTDQYSTNINSIIGGSAYLTLIMAYDCLLDCDGSYEKLVVYSMLNNGDTDTIGAVASGLYGAYYGFGDCPLNLLENIERKNDIIDISKNLQERYGKI